MCYLYSGLIVKHLACNGTRSVRLRTGCIGIDSRQTVHRPESSPTGQFTDKTDRRKGCSSTGQLADRIIRRQDGSPTGRLTNGTVRP